MLAMMAATWAANAVNLKVMKEKKTLVAYFSATGTTERVARLIASVTGADLFEIAPAEPYSAADLDWNDKSSRSSREMADEACRPALADTLADAARYDTLYVGFPVWWNEAPRAVNSFLESLDLEGVVVIPFATSGGSGIANSERRLRETYPSATWLPGRLLNGATRGKVEAWVEESRRPIGGRD